MNHKNIKEMKKVLVSAIAAVPVGIGLGYVCFNPENNLSDLEFANIEALSGGEAGSQVVSCYCKTKWFSPNVCSANASGAYCGGDPCSNHDGNCR